MSHEARHSSEEFVGSECTAPSQLRIAMCNRHDAKIRHGLKVFALARFASLFWSFWLAISEPGRTFRKKSPTWNPA